MEARIKKNKEKIVELLNKNIELEYKSMLKRATKIEDDEVNFGTKRNPDIKPVKRMYWEEVFIDEDTGSIIPIERHQLIEVEGKKCFRSGKLIEYYTIEDISDILT